MPIDSLNHVNVCTDDIEGTKDFYVDVIGLQVGFRPPFDEPGYWLYTGENMMIHLSPSEPDSQARSHPDYKGNGVDHLGIFASGLAEMKERLERLGVSYYTNMVGNGQIVQVVVYDPNGVMLELGYMAAAEGVTPENYEQVGDGVIGKLT